MRTACSPSVLLPFLAAVATALASACTTYLYLAGRSHLAGMLSMNCGNVLYPLTKTSEVVGEISQQATRVSGSTLS